MIRADLHSHTTCSDGALTPKELLARAHQHGITHFSITDHDTLAAYHMLQPGDIPNGLTVIVGIEISAWFECEVHILGLGVDLNHPRLLRTVSNLIDRRAERMGLMFDRLVRLGVFQRRYTEAERAVLRQRLVERPDIPIRQGEGFSVGGSACRLNLAHALMAAGEVSSIAEAMNRYIGSRAPAYVPYAKYPGAEAIEMIRDAAGVPILAHPGVYGAHCEAAIRAAAKAGIMGVEVPHPKHDTPTRTRIQQLVAELQLPFITGGSDYHGEFSRQAQAFGTSFAPPEMVAPLMDKIQERQSAVFHATASPVTP